MIVDYAAVDGNSAPDFAAAKQAGMSCAIVKVGEHVYPDHHFTRDWQTLGAITNVTRGLYGFPSFHRRMVNGRVISAASPAVQVKCWADTARAVGGLRRGVDLPPIFDLEFPGQGIVDTGRSQSECLQLVLQFIDAMRTEFGCTPMIYTSHVEYHDSNGLGGPIAPQLGNCPLWIKTPYRLSARQPVDQVAPRDPHLGHDALHDPLDLWRIPTPWENSGYWAQQWQGDALGFPGFNKTVDLSRFNVTRLGAQGPHVKQLQRWLKIKDDGAFGPITDVALRAFQLSHGLVVDGIVDLQTFAALTWQ